MTSPDFYRIADTTVADLLSEDLQTYFKNSQPGGKERNCYGDLLEGLRKDLDKPATSLTAALTHLARLNEVLLSGKTTQKAWTKDMNETWALRQRWEDAAWRCKCSLSVGQKGEESLRQANAELNGIIADCRRRIDEQDALVVGCLRESGKLGNSTATGSSVPSKSSNKTLSPSDRQGEHTDA